MASIRLKVLALVVGSVALISACGRADDEALPSLPLANDESFHPDGWPGVSVAPPDLYDPVAAGEPLPDGFRQSLDRDAIFPVYEPVFLPAEQSPWGPDELIIGVDLEGEARAYPVAFLNRREIVVDLHRGIPTFVTW